MSVETLPSASSVKLISFDSADVRPGFVNDSFFLIVRGEAPCLNMEVQLVPRIYLDCPEYWGIEVVGTLPGGICLTAMKPYVLTISLTGVTGSVGIEVIGSNKKEKFDVPGGCSGGAQLQMAG